MDVMTRRGAIACCVTGLVLVGGLAELRAGKPAPPPPPPSLPGTVYFVLDTDTSNHSIQGNIIQMAANGSAKAQSPFLGRYEEFGELVEPSTRVYGTDNRRWWLVSDNALYATKNGLDLILIGGRSVQDNGDQTETTLTLASNAVWSNNGQDSYIFAAGRRYLKDLTNNQVIRHEYVLFRIQISAADLEDTGDAVVPVSVGDPRLIELAVYQVPQGISAAYFELGSHSLAASPDGNQLVVSFHDETSSYSDLYRVDVTNSPVLFDDSAELVFSHDQNAVPWQAKWTPSSAASPRILFQSGGIIRSMNPDGTGIRTITSSGGAWPAWSPDGSHIVYSQSTKKGSTLNYNILRVPAGGGTAVNLTADLQPTYLKLPLAWRP